MIGDLVLGMGGGSGRWRTTPLPPCRGRRWPAAVIRLDHTRHDAIYNIGRATLVVQAFAKGDFDLLGQAMDDRLHQPYRKHLIKGYDDVVSAAKEAGAAAVAISGSGPTLIAFAPDRHKAIAHEMRQAFAVHEINSRAWVLEVDRLGARRV